ncbi:MAG: PASTA domain-containing protein [bacterium]|nr:PASTA domain-containing protein [bacterium]
MRKKKESKIKYFLISFFTSLIVAACVSYGIFQFFFKFKWVEVPKIDGTTLSEAITTLEKSGLEIIVEEERADTIVPEGKIISQQPLPWSIVRKGTLIRVVLSKGPLKIKMPNLIGMPLDEAEFKLNEIGLSVGEVKYEISDSAPNSIILSSPGPNEFVEKGKIVDLIVSRGAYLITVPNLFGKTLWQARKILAEKGLKIGDIYYTCDEEYRFGIIIRQDPPANTKVSKETPIYFTINREEK